MTNQDHQILIKQGVVVLLKGKPIVLPTVAGGTSYLSGANLSGANFRGDLSGANLSRTDLSEADLSEADLSRADLSEADLSRADLSEADLSRANLIGVNLIGTNLSRANLSRANLSRANLSGANLSEANLSGANLSLANFWGANLSGANLSEANLKMANLYGANLSGEDPIWAIISGANPSGADFSRSSLGDTIFANVNLSEAKNLDTCRHERPSILDFITLKQSGSLPLVFLRGCGLPNQLIDYLPSLLNQHIQYYSCFISYSSKDEDFAQRLHTDLQDKGVRCWFAPKDIKGGQKLNYQIDKAIRFHEKLLLVLSEHSMNPECGWVKTEIANARQRELREKRQVLFPIRLVDFEAIKQWECFDADTGVDSAKEIREYFIPDFSNWKDHVDYQKTFGQLLRDLKQELERNPAE